ncbi:hypothetical protein ACV3V0_07720 [Clostridium perfringens]
MKQSNNLYNDTNFHIRQTYAALKKEGELYELQKVFVESKIEDIKLYRDSV